MIYPDDKEIGFFFEFISRYLFFDILFKELSNKDIYLKNLLPFTFFEKKSKEIQKILKNKDIDFLKKINNLKDEIYNDDELFIYRFLWEIYYKEVYYFIKSNILSKIKLGKYQTKLEIFFDSGKLLNSEAFYRYGIINENIYFLIKEINQSFNSLLNEETQQFFKRFNKNGSGTKGHWFKSDFILKIKYYDNKNKKSKVNYISIDFSEFSLPIKVILKNIKKNEEEILKVLSRKNKKEINLLIDTLLYQYDFYKTFLILNEFKKLGNLSFINIEEDENNHTLFKKYQDILSNENDEYNDKYFKLFSIFGKPIQKIIQAGSYVYTLLNYSRFEQGYLFFNEKKEYISNIYLYSLGSIYQKEYIINETNKNELKIMYMLYTKSNKSYDDNTIIEILANSPYSTKIFYKKSNMSKDYLKYLLNYLIKKLQSKTFIKLTFNTKINEKEIFHLYDKINLKDINIDEYFINKAKFSVKNEEVNIREAHYQVFKYLLKNNKYIINCASPGMGKTTSIFKESILNKKDFYYFSSRISIIDSIKNDIMGDVKDFLNKFSNPTQDEIHKIKNNFNKVIYLTLNSEQIGEKTIKNNKEYITIKLLYYTKNKNIINFINNELNEKIINNKYIIIFEEIDKNNSFMGNLKENLFKKEQTINFTGKKQTKLSLNLNLGDSLLYVIDYVISLLKEKFYPIIVMTATLQALEKNHSKAIDFLLRINRNGNAFVMFDEIFGSTQPKFLLKDIIFNKKLFSEIQNNNNNVNFIIADANIKHENVIKKIIETDNNRKKFVNSLLFYENKGSELIKVSSFPKEKIKIPVILTNAFPAKNINIDFNILINRKDNKEEFKNIIEKIENNMEIENQKLNKKYSINLVDELVNEVVKLILDKIDGLGENDSIFVYIQNKKILENIENKLINSETSNINKNEILQITNENNKNIKDINNKKIILATSSASRGLTFKNVKEFIIVFQNFQIASGLNELAQVIFRGRGGNNDTTDKNFTFFITEDINELNMNILLYKFYNIFTKIFLILYTFSSFSGYLMRKKDNPKIKYGIIPIPKDIIGQELLGIEILYIKQEFLMLLENISKINNKLQKTGAGNVDKNKISNINNRVIKEFYRLILEYRNLIRELIEKNFNHEIFTVRLFKKEISSSKTNYINDLVFEIKVKNGEIEVENVGILEQERTIDFNNKIIQKIKIIHEYINEIVKNYKDNIINTIQASLFFDIKKRLDNIKNYIITFENSYSNRSAKNKIFYTFEEFSPLLIKKEKFSKIYEKIKNNDIYDNNYIIFDKEKFEEILKINELKIILLDFVENIFNPEENTKEKIKIKNLKNDETLKILTESLNLIVKLKKNILKELYLLEDKLIISNYDISHKYISRFTLFNPTEINFSKSFHIYSALYLFNN